MIEDIMTEHRVGCTETNNDAYKNKNKSFVSNLMSTCQNFGEIIN